MKSFKKNPCGALRLLAAVAFASAALSGAAQTAPEEIVVTSSIVEQPRRQKAEGKRA